MAKPGAPYRSAEEEDDRPVRRGAMGCVTWGGAIALLGLAVFAIVGAVRDVRRSSDLAEMQVRFASTLADARVERIVEAMRPSGQPMPDAAALDPGEQTEAPYTSNVERVDGAPELDLAARGLLVRVEDGSPTVDAAQLGTSRRAATRVDEVRWIGVVERDVIEGAYSFGAVRVNVEHVEIVIADLAHERPIARLTIEAAPPGHTSTPREMYELEDHRIWQAIEHALH